MRTIAGGTDTAFPSRWVLFDNIVPAAGKFMATLLSTHEFVSVEVRRIFCYNYFTGSPVSSKLLEHELLHILKRDVGTLIPIFPGSMNHANIFPFADFHGFVGSNPPETFIKADTGSLNVSFIEKRQRRFFARQGRPEPWHNTYDNALIWERRVGDIGIVMQGSPGLAALGGLGRGITIRCLTDPGANPGAVSFVFEYDVSFDHKVDIPLE